MAAVFRVIPTKILTLADLGLPEVLKSFAALRSGLVLVTGPTGSGKSTTLAAIIDYINDNYSRYILTIEEPIEFVHPNKRCVFCQREVGSDVHSFGEGLHTACRQDCDVILVGEMRDYETISLALSAASMGTLVFGTLHTNSAVKTIDRIIDVFPADQQGMARTMLADSLRGICAQLLLKKQGGGRIAANEILIGTTGLSASIRENNIGNIRNIIQGGKKLGMQMMRTNHLLSLQTTVRKSLPSILTTHLLQGKGRLYYLQTNLLALLLKSLREDRYRHQELILALGIQIKFIMLHKFLASYHLLLVCKIRKLLFRTQLKQL